LEVTPTSRTRFKVIDPKIDQQKRDKREKEEERCRDEWSRVHRLLVALFNTESGLQGARQRRVDVLFISILYLSLTTTFILTEGYVEPWWRVLII